MTSVSPTTSLYAEPDKPLRVKVVGPDNLVNHMNSVEENFRVEPTKQVDVYKDEDKKLD